MTTERTGGDDFQRAYMKSAMLRSDQNNCPEAMRDKLGVFFRKIPCNECPELIMALCQRTRILEE